MPPLHLLLAAAIFLPGQVLLLLSFECTADGLFFDHLFLVANVALNILLFYFTIVSQFADCVSASASGLAAHSRPGSLRLNSPVTH